MKVSLETLGATLKARDMPAAWGALRSLVLQPLSPLQWQRLHRLVKEHTEAWREFTQGRTLRVAVIGTYTTKPIADLVLPHLVAEGWWAEVYEGSYGSFETEPLTPTSELYAFAPDYVLIATGVTSVQEWPAPRSSESDVARLAEMEINKLRVRWNAIRTHSKAQIIQHNFEQPATRRLGQMEGRYPYSATRYVERLNHKLWECEGKEIRVLDVSQAAQHHGLRAWQSPRWYHHSKHGFDPTATGAYSLLFGGMWRALLGRTRKVLVCDLDNTLWGGVIGDDGLESIRLGSGSAEGEAYAAFQNYIKVLGQQGTLLAACSKNELAIAQEPFEKHPESPLKVQDFAVWECGWGMKSGGLRNIAQRLNVGLDSLVFIDDNEAECVEVSATLPEVTLVHLQNDPADFIRQVDDLYLFASLDLTTEDLWRTTSLKAAEELRVAAGQTETLETYLRSLEMQAVIREAGPADVPRVEQLFKKTNQFNLTGETWTQPELEALQQGQDSFVLSVWLKDRLATHGLVACAVLEARERVLEIRNWVMSCRVFSRTLEELVVQTMMELALKHDCEALRIVFRPSSKNGYAAAFMNRLGLAPEADSLTISVAEPPALPSFVALVDQV